MYLFQQPLCMAATLSSDNGQACAVELLVDVERIYVGHAADIVNHGHDSRFQMGRVYVILAAHPAHQLMALEWVALAYVALTLLINWRE